VGGNEKSLTSEASRDGVSRIAIAREVAPRNLNKSVSGESATF